MRVRIVTVPYDTAQYETRMGRGPGHLLKAGVVARLQASGNEVVVHNVDLKSQFPAEVETTFAVMAAVADEVRDACDEDQFPFVLAGNCNTTVGTVSGLGPRRVGVVWFDGHADLETPETTTSGYIDGMGLAILTGHCWQRLAKRISGFAPIPSEHVILAGSSDIETHERELLERSSIIYLSDSALNSIDGEHNLGEALGRLKDSVDGVHLHIDLDVHDPRIAPANHFRPPGGLSPDRLHEMIELVVNRMPVLSAAITAFDPDVDPERATTRSCLALIDTIAAHDPRLPAERRREIAPNIESG